MVYPVDIQTFIFSHRLESLLMAWVNRSLQFAVIRVIRGVIANLLTKYEKFEGTSYYLKFGALIFIFEKLLEAPTVPTLERFF